MQKGVIYGIAAYFLWGVFPIYWKMLKQVDALEVLLHRIVWSLVFITLILAVRKHWQWLSVVRERPRIIFIFVISALLLSINWFTFIRAVNNGYIVEASLGYFINPLFNVALGVVFLKERLRPWQGAAVFIAMLGVLYLTFNYGAFPWIALTLAFTFGMYGLLRKTAPLDSLEGLGVEISLIFLPALATVIYLQHTGAGAFLRDGLYTTSLLVLAGAVTAVPLLLFSAAVRRAPLVVIGLLQYLAPTLQFLLGVVVYNEPFNRMRFIGFCFIWFALAIYTVEGIVTQRRGRLAA